MTRPASVPLFDISRQHAELDAEIQAALARVCRSGKFVLGPECTELESAFAQYCGTKYAVACASGSDALLLALMAEDLALGLEGFVFVIEGPGADRAVESLP